MQHCEEQDIHLVLQSGVEVPCLTASGRVKKLNPADSLALWI
jgi:hypothetical protein